MDSDSDEFLQTVLATSKQRERSIPAGTNFWRSQLGHGWEPIYDHDGEHVDDAPGPLPPERMNPLPRAATEGRANPKGIPYLYLSTDKETAMAEVRPWVGSYISIAQFKTLRDLTIVDCSENRAGRTVYLEEPDPEERARAVWLDIDRAFAKPINPSDQTADYVPTQIISELFKNNGFDGIAYTSALGEGANIALFDLAAAELINCFLYKAAAVSFSFEEAANPYFVRKHYKKDKVT